MSNVTQIIRFCPECGIKALTRVTCSFVRDIGKSLKGEALRDICRTGMCCNHCGMTNRLLHTRACPHHNGGTC